MRLVSETEQLSERVVAFVAPATKERFTHLVAREQRRAGRRVSESEVARALLELALDQVEREGQEPGDGSSGAARELVAAG